MKRICCSLSISRNIIFPDSKLPIAETPLNGPLVLAWLSLKLILSSSVLTQKLVFISKRTPLDTVANFVFEFNDPRPAVIFTILSWGDLNSTESSDMFMIPESLVPGVACAADYANSNPVSLVPVK